VASALAAAFAGTAPAGAQPALTKDQCVDANGAGQQLRRNGSLSAAREAFRSCAVASCPELVRDDCTKRLDDVERAQPTIAFEARDPAGADVVAVHVTMDASPWTDSLEGKALPADPGEHLFAFTAAGFAPVALTLVLTEGEKGRRVRIKLTPAAPAPPIPAAAPAAATPTGPEPSAVPVASRSSEPGAGPARGLGTQRIAGLTVGLAGVVGLGVGSAFGLMTIAAWDRANRDCGGSATRCTNVPAGRADRSTAETDATISTVGFVAGGALVAAGLIVFFTAGPGAHSGGAAGWTIVPAAGPGGATVVVRGSF
jgi:hypothetical protein